MSGHKSLFSAAVNIGLPVVIHQDDFDLMDSIDVDISEKHTGGIVSKGVFLEPSSDPESIYHWSLDKLIDVLEHDYFPNEIVDRLVARGYPILRGELPDMAVVVGGKMYIPVKTDDVNTCSSCALLEFCGKYNLLKSCIGAIGYRKHWEEK